ncbi:hypothetical protein [Actinomadura atramentaria]|uniref:hypothetical protein n=1 Tax=Actinomadura atramentaria TaxID=1990 RepID=UPI0003691D2A|nr:hypothetical protein [Actinomadura atramentaria]
MSELLSAVTRTVIADRHMFGIAVEASFDPSRVPPPVPPPIPFRFSWFGASEYEILIGVEQELVDPQVRFELWDGDPPVLQEEPDVQGQFVLHISEGKLAFDQITAGGEPDVFNVPPGQYYLRLSGYGRTETARQAAELWRRYSEDDEFEDDQDPAYLAALRQLEGREHYLAQLWPALRS